MVSDGTSSNANLSVPGMDFMGIASLAEQFVLQYYTVMNKCPEILHRFYAEDSTLIYESPPIYGQNQIYNTFLNQKFSDTRVIILKVDALKANKNSVLVQVSGEISIANEEFRRFMRSFTLCEKSHSDFYVLNDIFRYQDKVYIAEGDNAEQTSGLEIKEQPNNFAEVVSDNLPQSEPQWVNPQPQEISSHSSSPHLFDQKEMKPNALESPLPPRSLTPESEPEERQNLTEHPEIKEAVIQVPETVAMSWAQRASVAPVVASSAMAHVPQTRQIPLTKHTAVANSTVLQKEPYKSQRGGRSYPVNNPRDSNVDRFDQQSQVVAPQFGRGGGGGPRAGRGGGRENRGGGSFRGGGGGMRGNRGTNVRH